MSQNEITEMLVSDIDPENCLVVFQCVHDTFIKGCEVNSNEIVSVPVFADDGFCAICGGGWNYEGTKFRVPTNDGLCLACKTRHETLWQLARQVSGATQFRA